MITQYNRAHFYPAIDTITVNKLTGSSSTHYLAPKKNCFFFSLCFTHLIWDAISGYVWLFLFVFDGVAVFVVVVVVLKIEQRQKSNVYYWIIPGCNDEISTKKKTKHYLWRSCHGAVETLALFTSACRYYFYFYFILHNFWIRFPFNQNSSTTSRYKQFYRNEMNHFFVLHTHFFFFFVVFHISNTDNNGLNWIFAFGN